MPQPQTRRMFRSRPSTAQSVRATVTTIQVERPKDEASRQISYQDEWSTLGLNFDGLTLPTPYEVSRLFQLIEESNMIRQCIDSYITNTVLTGWEVGPMQRDGKKNAGEENELQSFIDHSNSEQSLAGVMDLVIRDRESVGFGFMEIIRDVLGDISLLRHAPALHTRLGPKHKDDVLVEYEIARGRRVTTVKEWRKFRRYIQIIGGRTVYFKEFGDPRLMDYRNGAFEGEQGYDKRFQATEIYHFRLPSNEAYGVPRWINQLPNILGSREAEEVNMRYFQDNTVPPMLLTVAGGRLTQGSYRELSRALQTGAGKDRQNKILLLEAVGEGDSLDARGSPVQLSVEKLADQRQSDGLFAKYDEGNMAKIRSSFRLPPVSVGLSQDMTFATASVASFVAESQVFAPYRQALDEILNKLFVNGKRGLSLKTVKLVARTPSITSPDMVLKTLTALNVIGSVTPRSAQLIANKMLQMELTPYPEEGQDGWADWMDKPISITSGLNKTHAAQAQKTDAIKETEAEGDIGQRTPKNGDQTSAEV